MDKELKKIAMVKKVAEWPSGGNIALALAALAVAGAFAGGFGVGAATGKLTEPGEYDMSNLEKEQELARLHRDNQTQQILAEREDAERRMRNRTYKPMRIA